ncbi:protein Malvolio-like [Dermatophagoides pteronyssinus]|uniref:protein Malvolio-like n=1 Tax=Dermatophagoides pteronyssinus TaxID=6956 RepID=UPI003F676579
MATLTMVQMNKNTESSETNNENENGQKKLELDTYFQSEIDIPECLDNDYSFKWKRLWAFTGPGLLMSIAYLDPGNIESDMQCGVIADYKLLWILLWSTLLGLLIQILSARIGIVTGKHLAELCYSRYHRIPRLLLWIMTEIAIIGSDMQEVIGTSLALYMLTNRWLPLWAGVLITIFDTFSFLFLDKFGVRKLESFFGFLIAIMAVTFGYEFFVVQPDIKDIVIGSALPYCSGCNKKALLQAVGIIGAIIQPHNLYLHSALVKSRRVNNKKSLETKDANRYVSIESAIVLFISLLINLAVISVFAKGLFGKTNHDVYEICEQQQSSKKFIDMNVLKNDNQTFDADLYQAGIYLGCEFGSLPFYIWAIGILAAGQSSTMTGTYAGQFSMEGFLNLKWPRWKRVLLTRSIAIAPTFFVTIFSDVQSLTGMNDYLNALMVIQLPFAVLPTLTFSSSTLVMGKFVNNFFNFFIATTLSIAVIVINIYFVIQLIIDKSGNYSYITYPVTFIIGSFYLIFILYLKGCFLSVLGVRFHQKIPLIGKYFQESNEKEYKYLD